MEPFPRPMSSAVTGSIRSEHRSCQTTRFRVLNVQSMRRIYSFPRLFFYGLSKAHTGATPVLVDEYDALPDQDLLDQIERSGVPRIPSHLNVRYRIPMQTGRRGHGSDSNLVRLAFCSLFLGWQFTALYRRLANTRPLEDFQRLRDRRCAENLAQAAGRTVRVGT